MKIKKLLTVILFFFSVQSCAQYDPSKSVSVNEFKERVSKNDSTMIILDVRTEAEITGPLTKIDGAIHIPVQQLEGRVNELEKYKGKQIIIVCRTQNRSSRATDFLSGKGYNAKYLTGGMMEYYKK